MDPAVKKALKDFNESISYEEIREVYKNQFQEIKNEILSKGPKLAIEDIIIMINTNDNKSKILYNLLLFELINRGIEQNTISIKDLE
ncbi:hypothetical protein [Elizabethkingia anophelis]|uniref:hypothetical protein n=1 Tax=Elizabethkingia anophelis TaxID=1117645 RepID=UPI000994CD72|nr:hypothetical protein [Elizabethkingia anophelis]AQW92983.1 hypothetical protein BBD30_01660 [Elizabethkingia anophelis]OPB61043.1 hypothetical protein BAS07_01090 [Elizabethkingia anophelis]